MQACNLVPGIGHCLARVRQFRVKTENHDLKKNRKIFMTYVTYAMYLFKTLVLKTIVLMVYSSVLICTVLKQ
jgi:hypothetical protein